MTAMSVFQSQLPFSQVSGVILRSGRSSRLTGCGQSNTTGPDREREDLANENPGTRAPSRAEEEDEDSDERNLGVNGGDVVSACNIGTIGARNLVGLVEARSNTDNGNDELNNVRR